MRVPYRDSVAQHPSTASTQTYAYLGAWAAVRRRRTASWITLLLAPIMLFIVLPAAGRVLSDDAIAGLVGLTLAGAWGSLMYCGRFRCPRCLNQSDIDWSAARGFGGPFCEHCGLGYGTLPDEDGVNDRSERNTAPRGSSALAASDEAARSKRVPWYRH